MTGSGNVAPYALFWQLTLLNLRFGPLYSGLTKFGLLYPVLRRTETGDNWGVSSVGRVAFADDGYHGY